MPDQLFTVRNQVVLITGSTRGLGFSFAAGFARAGATVVINGVDSNRMDSALEKLRANGLSVHGKLFDVTDQAAVVAAVDAIEQEVGPIEILVNNAGIHRRAPLEEMKLEDWREVIDVNLTSMFIVAQAVVRHMRARSRGKIINISSLNAQGARPTIGNYCAAKGGVNSLTRAMATEWGKYNINVNAIGPGYFLTDLTKKLAENPTFDAWVKQEVPLGRWGVPDELVGTALYLASAASSYVNGTTIYVDGGWQGSL